MTPKLPFMFHFERLPTKTWVTDLGFRKCLDGVGGERYRGYYYQQNKSDMTLLDLVQYQDEEARERTLAYFELPADTIEFLQWVFGWVAYIEPLPAGVERQHVLPYALLYPIYRNEGRHFPDGSRRTSNVNVYADRIAESNTGQMLATR